MHLTFSTQHIHGGLGDSIQNYAKERLTEMLHKYIHLENPKLEQLLTVNVHFSKDIHGFKCTIIISKLEHESDLKVEALSLEIDDSFDQAIHQLEKPLKKYQSKLKDHHSIKTVEAEQQAMQYALHSMNITDKEDLEDNLTKIIKKN